MNHSPHKPIAVTATATTITTNLKPIEEALNEGKIAERAVTRTLKQNGWAIHGNYKPNLEPGDLTPQRGRMPSKPQRASISGKNFILPDITAGHPVHMPISIEIKGKGKLYDPPDGLDGSAVWIDDYHHHDMGRYERFFQTPVFYVVVLAYGTEDEEIICASISQLHRKMSVTDATFKMRGGYYRDGRPKNAYRFPYDWFKPFETIATGMFRRKDDPSFIILNDDGFSIGEV